ncbi:MAG: hypothetical protein JRG70_05935 [Deltaproteobacteria bacterium]|nr:hypothetical protein [Deltaproteobacteria bacterium]
MQPGARTFTPESYISVWEAWTRDKESFSWKELAHEIHVAATFESWEFRWAYVVRYAYDYSLKPEARDEMLDASLASSRQEHRFFVTLSGMDFRESNLAGKSSAWRVLLIDPAGNQTVPVLMERVKRPTAVDRVYFPQVSPYRETFRLTFPAVEADGRKTIPDGAKFILLRFTGARGRADLRWDLQPTQGA